MHTAPRGDLWFGRFFFAWSSSLVSRSSEDVTSEMQMGDGVADMLSLGTDCLIHVGEALGNPLVLVAAFLPVSRACSSPSASVLSSTSRTGKMPLHSSCTGTPPTAPSDNPSVSGQVYDMEVVVVSEEVAAAATASSVEPMSARVRFFEEEEEEEEEEETLFMVIPLLR